jgi:hypothetical protein
MTTGQALDGDYGRVWDAIHQLQDDWRKTGDLVLEHDEQIALLRTYTHQSAPAPTPAPIPPLDARLVAVVPFHQGTGGMWTVRDGGAYDGYQLFQLAPSHPRHATLSYRSEMHNNDHVDSFPRRRAYGLTYVIPKDWHLGQTPDPDFWDDRIIFQIHENNGSPVLSLHLNETDNTVSIRRKRDASENAGKWQHYARVPVEFDKPVRFKLLVDYATAGGGFYATWDGAGAGEWLSARGLLTTGGSRPYSKWGIYGQPTQLYAGDLKIADGHDALKLVG